MTPELRDLYQDIIIDHNRSPRNFKKLADCTCKAKGYNPLCGDDVQVYLKLANGIIADISFEGKGCAISTASASLLTEQLKGKTSREAEHIFQSFHTMVTADESADIDPALGKLKVFAGVRAYPARVKCATLVWHTLHGALNHQDESITTE